MGLIEQIGIGRCYDRDPFQPGRAQLLLGPDSCSPNLKTTAPVAGIRLVSAPHRESGSLERRHIDGTLQTAREVSPNTSSAS